MSTATTSKPKSKAADRPKGATMPASLSAKAKSAYAKGAALASGVGAFTRANAAAIGMSGKILGAGLRQIGNEALAEGKVAVTTVKGDFAELKAVRSPVDLVRLQSKLLGRNFGAVSAFGIKRADAAISLAEASALPIAYRMDAAIRTIRKAA